MVSIFLTSLLHAPGEPHKDTLVRRIEASFGAQSGPGLVAETVILLEAAVTRLAKAEGKEFIEVLKELEEVV